MYRSIEQSLRNRGHTDAADEIYRAMWQRSSPDRERMRHLWKAWRAWRPAPGGLGGLVSQTVRSPFKREHWTWSAPARWLRLSGRLIWSWAKFIVKIPLWLWDYIVWERLLRFGTDPLRLLVVIFAVALLSVPVYLHASNIGAAPAASSLAKSPDAPTVASLAASPAYPKWQWNDAVALLVRKHLPILALRLRPEWEMRDTRGVDYDLRVFTGGSCRPGEPERATDFVGNAAPDCTDGWHAWGFRASWLSAEDWAATMGILNLLMWPLVLGFAIRRLLRQ
jgi:hypothetical protein